MDQDWILFQTLATKRNESREMLLPFIKTLLQPLVDGERLSH